ncbi:DUF4355 domain-containing protein [Clostridium perfringens]|uniref:DUF4355 domain-containing protein n=1 Tax=Clostridium perfringens TaxID=1502 RepID=UPI00399C7850
MKNKFIRKMLEADTGTGVNGGGNQVNSDTTTTDNTTETTDNSNNQTETTEKTFTQKDVDKLIQDRLAREQSKWEKRVKDERTEAEKLAKMNAEQKAKYAEDKRIEELERREKEITTRELKAQAYETLAEKNLPKELIGTINFESAETCNASIEAVEKAFQSAVEKAVNEKLRGGDPPKSSQGKASIDAALRAAFGLK